MAVLGLVYVVLATYVVQYMLGRPFEKAEYKPPISILKPLCGDEPGLYEDLRSFCIQDYPEFEVVFSVRDAEDASIPVVRRLMSEIGEANLKLVVDSHVEGRNLKVACLDNALASTSHDVLILADSDIRVGPDYLSTVVSPLSLSSVGAVTCLYSGRSVGNIWSRLGVYWINYHFLPSVLMCWLLGARVGCFGSTIVLRRECLQGIGGFAAIKDELADDYALGRAVRRGGWGLVLSPYLVETTVSETSAGQLFTHELRWNRTIRSLVPLGHYASVITNPVALSLIGVVLAGGSWVSLSVFGIVVCARLWMARTIDRYLGVRPGPAWLIPCRDVFSLAVFAGSVAGSRVTWRGHSLHIDRKGKIRGDGLDRPAPRRDRISESHERTPIGR